VCDQMYSIPQLRVAVSVEHYYQLCFIYVIKSFTVIVLFYCIIRKILFRGFAALGIENIDNVIIYKKSE